MFEIKITLDATQALLDSLARIADALSVPRVIDVPAPSVPAEEQESTNDKNIDGNAENLDSTENIEQGKAETPAEEEQPKKRRSRAKKAQSEVEEAEDAVSVIARCQADAIKRMDEEMAIGTARATLGASGKGETGEILVELTRKAVRELDELGVSRELANRRVKDYCNDRGIKFPTFPALLQAVGYDDAIAICKG